MYESFFGLRERAFDLTPNPRFLLLTPGHREALCNLQYGVASNQGVMLLIGESGTGKTTVLRRAMMPATAEQGARHVSWVHLNNPKLERGEFIEFLATGFVLSTRAGGSKTRFLRELEHALRRRHEEGTVSALVVDEAQSLPDELLEEIRLLANVESDTHKLLTIVLSGQPELGTRLNEWQFRHLKQRIALRCTLPALTLEESAAYIAGRVRLAGGDAGRIFSREAVIAIHERARGIPRTINVICENALLSAYAVQRTIVCADLVDEVSRDFDLESPGPLHAASNHRTPATSGLVRPFRPAPAAAAGGASVPSLRQRSQPRGALR